MKVEINITKEDFECFRRVGECMGKTVEEVIEMELAGDVAANKAGARYLKEHGGTIPPWLKGYVEE